MSAPGPDDSTAPAPPEEPALAVPRAASAPTLAGDPPRLLPHRSDGETFDPRGDSLPDTPARTPTDGSPAVVTEAAGRYDALDNELGRGGIGRVLLVRDTHLGRDVAVKELLAGGSAAGRFLREARVTAQLEHPNIVPVYELGRRQDGTLYYTMKHVRGRTFADVLAECDTMDERLRLLAHFVATCNAVAYAHSRGVVHRDIKPGNIMVGEFGETVLLDWGLAKVQGQRDLRGSDLERELNTIRGDAHATMQGAAMGTPAYMSPEQAEGRIDAIDARSDVWSLGAVLFEILTGVPPFVGRTAMETLLMVVNEPPPRADEAPPDLANVCAKALQRDPARRYPSAGELAEEVLEWQAGRTVRAHRYSPAEIVQKWLARNRGRVMAAVVTTLAIAAAGGYWSRGVVGAREAAIDVANVATGEAGSAFASLADAALFAGDPEGAWMYAAGALLHGEDPAARGALLAAASGWLTERAWGAGLGEVAWGVRYSPDGTALAFAGNSGIYQRIEGADRLTKVELTGGTAPVVGWLPPAGLLSARGDGSISVWRERQVVRRFDLNSPVRAIASAPGGLVLGTQRGTIERWDAARGQRLWRVDAGQAPLSVAAGDEVVAAAFDGADTRLWVGLGERRLPPATTVALSPEGRLVALALSEAPGVVEVWAASTGERRLRLDAHQGAVRALALSAASGALATGGDDGVVRLWDSTTGRALGRLRLGPPLAGVDWLPSGAGIAAVSRDGEAVEWLGARPEAAVAPTDEAPPGARRAADRVEYLSPDGGVVLASDPLPAIVLHVVRRGEQAAAALVDGRVAALDGKRVVGSSVITGAPMGVPLLSPDGRVVYAAEPSGAVWAWEFGGMAVRSRMVALPPGDVALAASDDGRWLAGGGADGTIAVWSAATGDLLARFRAHRAGVARLHLDGDTLRSVDTLGGVQAWPLRALTLDAGAAMTEGRRRFALELVDGRLRLAR